MALAGRGRTQRWSPGPKACAAGYAACRSAGELMHQRSLRPTAAPWTASAARDELPLRCGSAPTLHAGELDFFLVADSERSGETLQPRRTKVERPWYCRLDAAKRGSARSAFVKLDRSGFDGTGPCA